MSRIILGVACFFLRPLRRHSASSLEGVGLTEMCIKNYTFGLTLSGRKIESITT